MEEIWKDIDGYEGLYQVSSLGNVRSLNYRRLGYSKNLTPKTNRCGRLWVELYKDGVGKPMQIHRLVGLAFIDNPLNLPQINHLDENPKNNRADNLEWCTLEYNVMYSVRRHPDRYGNRSVWKKTKHGRQRRDLRRRKIDQLAIDGTLVARWDSVNTIKDKIGVNAWFISECCRGNRKTAYGFRWQYAT